MRRALVAVAAAAALAAGVAAAAAPKLPGIPAYAQPYAQWHKVNKRPLTTPGAHPGRKNVYASKRARRGRYPNGTIIVKEARDPAGFVSLIAVMRKRAGSDRAHGNWQFIEWTRNSRNARFREIARDGVCWSCHAGAKKTDWVFTTR